MIFVWLITGCLAVAAAFFLPGTSIEVWPNLNAGGIALAVYTIALLVAFARKKDITVVRRNVVLACGVIAIGTTWFAWRTWDDQSHWQANTLGEIGAIISRGVYKSHVTDSLLNVLERYYDQKGHRRQTIGQLYRSMYPPGVVGDSFSTQDQLSPPERQGLNPGDVFLMELSDTHVVWVARHPWYIGRNPAFKNVMGKTGKVQGRATLTSRGLQYESEN